MFQTGYIHTSNDSYTIAPIYPGSQEDYPWHQMLVVPRDKRPNLFDVVGGNFIQVHEIEKFTRRLQKPSLNLKLWQLYLKYNLYT